VFIELKAMELTAQGSSFFAIVGGRGSRPAGDRRLFFFAMTPE